MSALPKLNFPPIRLRARRRGGGEEVEIWDPVRGIYLVLTPEEWAGDVAAYVGLEMLMVMW